MTVSSDVSKVAYATNGTTGPFSVPFYFIDSSHLRVVYSAPGGGDTVLSLGADFSVSGAGNLAGGSVSTTTAYAAGGKLTIVRNVPMVQDLDLRDQDAFPAESLERALDKQMMLIQQRTEQLSRALLFPVSAVGLNNELPLPSPSALLGWNAGASAIENKSPADLATAISYANWATETFNGNGVTTDFTLTDDPGNASNCDVSVGGVAKTAGIDFTLDGKVITFTSAPLLGTNNIAVRYGRALPQGVINWGQIIGRPGFNVTDFGAVGDGVTDDSAALQAAIDAAAAAGRALFFPPGVYAHATPLVYSFSASTSPEDRRVSFLGESCSSCVLLYTGSSGAQLSVTGGTSGGIEANIEIHGLYFKGPGSGTTTGLAVDNVARMTVSECRFRYHQYGIDATDWLTSNLYSVELRWNRRGARLQYANASRPNAINFIGCQIGNNYEYGVHCIGGSCLTFIAGTIEGNGVDTGVASTGRWGLKVEEAGVEGAHALTMVGVYVENNSGRADVWLAQSVYNAGYCITGCTFNRIDSGFYTTANIFCEWTCSTKKMVALIQGNSFCGLGTYVENILRPYIDMGSISGALWDIKQADANYFGAAVAAPANGPLGVRGQALVEARFNGTPGGPDLSATLTGRNVATVTKNGTGDYTINFFRALPSGTNRYSISVSGAVGVGYAWAESTTSLQIKTTNLSGTATDFDGICVEVFGDTF